MRILCSQTRDAQSVEPKAESVEPDGFLQACCTEEEAWKWIELLQVEEQIHNADVYFAVYEARRVIGEQLDDFLGAAARGWTKSMAFAEADARQAILQRERRFSTAIDVSPQSTAMQKPSKKGRRRGAKSSR